MCCNIIWHSNKIEPEPKLINVAIQSKAEETIK